MAKSLTPELLLQAYATGIFPMAEDRDSREIHWVDPSRRGVIPMDGFHISRSLRKAILKTPYSARFNTDFETVLKSCADRELTWINDEIHRLYLELHRNGFAHSQEIWLEDELIGGVYGVAIGKVFFGESMFSKRNNTSKIALAWLIDRLRLTGFSLFDTQFLTPHLASLGATEIERADYIEKLREGVESSADILDLRQAQTAQDVIQRNTQTS